MTDTNERRRVCKVVRRKAIGVANAYHYAIWVYRVMECWSDQVGYLNEKDVICLHESVPCTYRSTKPGTKDYEARAEAERIAAAGNRRLALGLAVDTPDGIVADYEAEHAGRGNPC